MNSGLKFIKIVFSSLIIICQLNTALAFSPSYKYNFIDTGSEPIMSINCMRLGHEVIRFLDSCADRNDNIQVSELVIKSKSIKLVFNSTSNNKQEFDFDISNAFCSLEK